MKNGLSLINLLSYGLVLKYIVHLIQFVIFQALSSLQKYPLPLNSGKECLILKYFGPKLCTKLDNKLKEHKLSSDTGK